MQQAAKTGNQWAGHLRARRVIRLRNACAALFAACSLNATATAQSVPGAASVNIPVNSQATSAAQPGPSPIFNTLPVAIVPLDRAMPGAALEVAGPMQAWNGKAYLTGSGSITAGIATAEVALPSRGTLRVCASSTVKLAADANAPEGEVPGLLMVLDRGALEMSLAPSEARAKNADTLLTPYFRILIGGPNAVDVKVRLGEHGDTCVDNAGADAPYVLVTSVFDGGIYRVQPGQRVMFERGNLQSVVDQEKEPCGCPPPLAEARGNEFPLAQSEGLALGTQPPVVTPPAHGANATTTLSYNGADHTAQAEPVTAATPVGPAPAPAVPSPDEQPKQKKPGFFTRVGRFFRKVFGAE